MAAYIYLVFMAAVMAVAIFGVTYAAGRAFARRREEDRHLREVVARMRRSLI